MISPVQIVLGIRDEAEEVIPGLCCQGSAEDQPRCQADVVVINIKLQLFVSGREVGTGSKRWNVTTDLVTRLWIPRPVMRATRAAVGIGST